MALEEFEFKEVLKKEGLNQKKFAEKIGMSHAGVRNGLARGNKKGVAFWLKAFLFGYNLKNEEK